MTIFIKKKIDFLCTGRKRQILVEYMDIVLILCMKGIAIVKTETEIEIAKLISTNNISDFLEVWLQNDLLPPKEQQTLDDYYRSRIFGLSR